jgi:hypothetical protein
MSRKRIPIEFGPIRGEMLNYSSLDAWLTRQLTRAAAKALPPQAKADRKRAMVRRAHQRKRTRQFVYDLSPILLPKHENV